MARKYWYSLFFLFSFLIKVSGQYPASTFGHHHSYYFNPAMVGIEKKRTINLNYNLNEDEKYGLISYEHPSKNLNHNIGCFLKIYSGRYEAVNSIGLAYNYTFKTSENISITPGFQFTQFYIGSSRSSVTNSRWEFKPNMDLGLVLAIKKIRIGVSVFDLWQLIENDDPIVLQSPFEKRSFNGFVSQKIKAHKKLDLTLAFLYHKRTNNTPTIDLSGHALISKTFMLGGTLRVEDEPFAKLFLGIRRWEYISFQISIDTKKGSDNFRHTELLLKYDL